MAARPPTLPELSRITSGYGTRLGRSGRPTFHAGLDFLGKRGEPIFSVLGGDVVVVVRDNPANRGTRGYGNVVAVDHRDGWWTIYAHLDTIAVLEGQRVVAGDPLGTVGSTSDGKFRGMGAHLHFEVRNAAAGAPFPAGYRRFNTDPLPWLTERGLSFDARGRYLGERGGQA